VSSKPLRPTIVYAGGTFDLFHAGHVEFLRRASLIGPVVVGLNSDEFAARYKRKPIMSYEERRIVLASCKHVSRVIRNIGDEDSRPAILSSGATVIVHGDDWTGESLTRQLGVSDQWLDDHGIELRYLPYSPLCTTTEVIERCRRSPR
jgi:glycerol-3-phosphate cytidylyltransferase